MENYYHDAATRNFWYDQARLYVESISLEKLVAEHKEQSEEQVQALL